MKTRGALLLIAPPEHLLRSLLPAEERFAVFCHLLARERRAQGGELLSRRCAGVYLGGDLIWPLLR